MSSFSSNNIPHFLASLVGQQIEFKGKQYKVLDWVREDTFARISTDTGFLQIPYQYVKDVKLIAPAEPAANTEPVELMPERKTETAIVSTPPTEPTVPVATQAVSPSEIVVRENNPGLMFQELADFGMDTLKKLKSKTLKPEEAQTIFTGMEAMVKVGSLQIRAYEVMKDMGKNSSKQ